MKREIKLILLVFALVVGPAVALSIVAARVLGSWQVVLQKRMETDAAQLLAQAMQGWEQERAGIRQQAAESGLQAGHIAALTLAHPWVEGIFVFQSGRGLIYPPAEGADATYVPPALHLETGLPSPAGGTSGEARDPDEGFFPDLIALKSQAESALTRGDQDKARALRDQALRLVLDRYDTLAPLQREIMVEWIETSGKKISCQVAGLLRNSPSVSSLTTQQLNNSATDLPRDAEWRERMRGRRLSADQRAEWGRELERLAPAVRDDNWIRARFSGQELLVCALAGKTFPGALLALSMRELRLVAWLEWGCRPLSRDTGIEVRVLPGPSGLPPLCLASMPFQPPLESLMLVATPADPHAFLANARLQSRLYRWGGGLLLVVVLAGAWLIWREAASEIRQARQRSAFAAVVSHDLRTPLSSMRMLAESLQMGGGEDAAKRQKFLGAIVRESDRLSRLTDRALYFIRYGQGALRYRLTEGDIGVLVRETVEAFAGGAGLAIQDARCVMQDSGYQMPDAGCSIQHPASCIRVDIAPTLPPVRFDSGAMEQVVFNLLDNAVKYSGQGNPVRIEVALQARPVRRWGANRHAVVLSVRDHGVGMTREEARRVVKPYVRGRGGEASNAGGIGLGLSLCREVASAHGGRLEIESEPGQGSTFKIILPVSFPG